MAEGFEAVCTDCAWDAVYPTRETAEHAKRVHEAEEDHGVLVQPLDG